MTASCAEEEYSSRTDEVIEKNNRNENKIDASITNYCHEVGRKSSTPPSSLSVRAYSRKHRVYVMRDFLISTYGEYLKVGDGYNNSNNNTSNNYDSSSSVILDIAGGKGDLSWILQNIDNIQSIVVDPRQNTIDRIERTVEYLRSNPTECIERSIPGRPTHQPLASLMPKLAAKDYKTISPFHIRIFVDEKLIKTLERIISHCNTFRNGSNEDYKQVCSCCLNVWKQYWDNAMEETAQTLHSTQQLHNDDDTTTTISKLSRRIIVDANESLEIILYKARLIVGFHPDQATDYCFQLAKLLQIPVCVVPCCVFPSQFIHRKLLLINNNNTNEEERNYTKVKNYNDLIQYLIQQNNNIHITTLPFLETNTARNIVLYTLPES